MRVISKKSIGKRNVFISFRVLVSHAKTNIFMMRVLIRTEGFATAMASFVIRRCLIQIHQLLVKLHVQPRALIMVAMDTKLSSHFFLSVSLFIQR